MSFCKLSSFPLAALMDKISTPVLVKSTQIFLSVLSLVLFITAAVSTDWVKTETGNSGVFLYNLSSDKSDVKEMKCEESMSQTDCGYLQSSQSACVVAIIFGWILLYWLANQYWIASPFNSFLNMTLSFAQFCFALICLVVFTYFKKSELESDDGVNVEYPVDTYSKYEYATSLWLSGVVFTLLISILSAGEVYRMSRVITATAVQHRDVENPLTK